MALPAQPRPLGALPQGGASHRAEGFSILREQRDVLPPESELNFARMVDRPTASPRPRLGLARPGGPSWKVQRQELR